MAGYEWFNRNRAEQSIGLAEGLMAASSAKVSVAQYYQMEGKLPRSNKEVDLPPAQSYAGTALVALEIQDEGVITLTYNENSGVDDGRVRLIPDVGNGAIGLRWKCETADYSNMRNIMPGCVYVE